ncbi:helix-turn-helix domain-containing protein [Mycobacterium sp. 236(2023)]|uniref:AraC family transcriptional regulator n=1 Tax=Mycobacterium sp. 236(2023) TaxID=3038163 RepID=UPI0024151A57|nr:helix-turn-helix domain-containing protein [Mycobacterium sp. 236(2023)]MDG4665435.1 helix-turn-helix domain-containing protein [Mycobacterium sp. 236(2023)]
MSYREMPAPAALRDLAECVWVKEGAGSARILPDGCMDLIELDDELVIAGPDTVAHISEQSSVAAAGIRFRPGALPRLLGVPAHEFHGERVELGLLRPEFIGAPLLSAATQLMRRETSSETAPWPVPQLSEVTRRFAAGAAVRAVAGEIGCSPRNLQRQSAAVYGYSPATLRRILRFRRAVRLLRSGRTAANTAHVAGYADQAHLSRQVRELAGVPVTQLFSGANKSTEVPSGSRTVA